MYKSDITFVIHLLLITAQSWAESIWEITNYGRFINQSPLNIIRSKGLTKKYIDKKYLLRSIKYVSIYIYIYIYTGGARDVMLIIVGNEHGDTSSNPGQDLLHFP